MVRYQVFLSFRGSDTRDNLIQYLYDQLKRLGIVAFLDSEEIDYGEEIGTEIVEAIKHSDICVPVFSLDFASSPACLMEVAQMVELKKKILPIFFFVEPCDVRYQRRTYKKSFAEHKRKKRYSKSTIKKWKEALEKIAYNRGPEFKKASYNRGPEFKKASLEAPLEAALEVALREIGGTRRLGVNRAALEAALKPALRAALEAALGEIGVIKGPEKAAPGEIRGTKGRFYNDLFSGFRELEVFISELWKLSRMDEQGVTRNLVGIDGPVRVMMQKLGFDYEDGRVVKKLEMTERMVFVVFGLPKVGKTTLTKVVFRKIRHLFKGSSFLENVWDEFNQKREVSLQNKLIRQLKSGGACPEVEFSSDATTLISKMFQEDRVLIVLDNVDRFDQIKIFAEELTWFGPGSMIIITTTEKNVITNEYLDPEKNRGKVFDEHEVLCLNDDDALDLLCKHAFPSGRCPEDYENCSREIIYAIKGLPFPIEMVGKDLCGKSKEHWEDTLKYLNHRPEENLEKELMEKYFQGLHADAKQIFFDIACFFIGVEKRIPYYMWDACEWNPHKRVGHLESKSFLRIGEDDEFGMHNQLKLLGREIVKNEDKDPRQRSRLWDNKEVEIALRAKKGTSRVKALRVTPAFGKVDDEVIRDLSNLRFLELDKVNIEGNPTDLLPHLLWLDWRGCPKKSSGCPEESSGCPEKSMLSAFNMKKLVILNLSSRPDKLTVKEWEQLMEKAESLEVLQLKDCTWIKASLEFPASSLLKCLILEGSLHLKLDTTNSNFENLVSFSMKGCKWVKQLPPALCSMKALKELLVDKTHIKKLQFKKGSLPALEILSACKCTELREVTDSIGLLTNLRKLSLKKCKGLNTLPRVFGKLVLLQEMDLSYTSIGELPPCVKECNKLEVLKMVRTKLETFPEAIKNLKELKELDFTLCKGLKGQCDITGLFSLRILRLTGTEISELLTRDEGRFCLPICELDHGVTRRTQASQKKSSVSKLKRKRQTQTNQEECNVSKHKSARHEE